MDFLIYFRNPKPALYITLLKLIIVFYTYSIYSSSYILIIKLDLLVVVVVVVNNNNNNKNNMAEGPYFKSIFILIG